MKTLSPDTIKRAYDNAQIKIDEKSDKRFANPLEGSKIISISEHGELIALLYPDKYRLLELDKSDRVEGIIEWLVASDKFTLEGGGFVLLTVSKEQERLLFAIEEQDVFIDKEQWLLLRDFCDKFFNIKEDPHQIFMKSGNCPEREFSINDGKGEIVTMRINCHGVITGIFETSWENAPEGETSSGHLVPCTRKRAAYLIGKIIHDSNVPD